MERMLHGGADKICFVISPGKSDIMEYYGAGYGCGGDRLCGAAAPERAVRRVFRALPLIAPDEQVIVGLPDTVWFPEEALAQLPDDTLSFLLFPGGPARILRRGRARSATAAFGRSR